MSTATADWRKVGDQFYRKIQLYTNVLDADLELENYIVSGAPYSGAVGRHFLHLRIDSTDRLQHSTAMRLKCMHTAQPK